jgi:RimJ/RimL family protein N-acetyltransferase
MFPDLTRDDVFRLETRRLWLRWPCRADAAAVARQAGEKVVAEMTAQIPHPYPPGEAERFILATRKDNEEGTALALAVALKGRPDALIGMVRIGPGPHDGRPHLGYWLGLPHCGHGYATEAARALVDAWFAYTEAGELCSSVRVINPASRRVLEKCGFAFRGSGLVPLRARGGVFPADEFVLDRRIWESLKSWGRAGFVPQARADLSERLLPMQ